MNELSPVFDKLPKFFDGQETLTTMNRARTWQERIQKSKEDYEKNKDKKQENEEKSIQELLYGIKQDMGEEQEIIQSQKQNDENER